eukprot:NODE_30488_length_417_cov_1.262069.p3 GENE.NODE_30488_length_417_cov_1.262069~~NODE_30488_length_417_cov_1.262069.p3  ORF type:complete len:51 (-),score=5.40 NODE_30488_length_417_cov_1.262069:9-161(-)
MATACNERAIAAANHLTRGSQHRQQQKQQRSQQLRRLSSSWLGGPRISTK